MRGGTGTPVGTPVGTPQSHWAASSFNDLSLLSLGFKEKWNRGTFARGDPFSGCKSPDSLYEKFGGQGHLQGHPPKAFDK